MEKDEEEGEDEEKEEDEEEEAKKGGWAKEEDSDRRELSQAASAAIPQRRTLSLAYFFSILTNTFQYLDDMQIQYLSPVFVPSQLNAFLFPLFQAGFDKRSGRWSPFRCPWYFDIIFVFSAGVFLYLYSELYCICTLGQPAEWLSVTFCAPALGNLRSPDAGAACSRS